MIAVVVEATGGPDALVCREVPTPEPGPGQVTIDVEAAGVAYADVLLRRGVYPDQAATPFTPGYDVVGRVRAAGADVPDLAVGDRVAALTVTGGYAEVALAAARWVVPVPADLPAAALTALVLNYVTARQLLTRMSAPAAGDTVLVHGAAGGVGTALLELAALDGIDALGVASGARTEAVAGRGGHPIDRRTADVLAAVRARVPDGVAATYDPVGGPHLRLSRAATRRGGTVVSYGFSFAVDRGLGRTAALAHHGAALARARVTPGPPVRLYVIAGGRGFANRHPELFRADLASLVGMLAEGRLSPEVDPRPLADASAAHADLEAGAVVGKLVLLPGAPAPRT